MKDKSKSQRKFAFLHNKTLWWIVAGIIGVVLLIAIAFRVSPWPGAMIIRLDFELNGMKTSQALDKHTSPTPISVISNQYYRPDDRDAVLDVYFPESVSTTDKKLPVVIWTHGGAWVSGGKADYAAYFKLLAAEGFTVISGDYSLAPERTYPTAVHQLNDMHAYIKEHAGRFHADTSKIVLAGDSAGSQLSSQLAAIITNPKYASEVGVRPNITPEELKGVVLNCGIYKMEGLVQPNPNLPKIIGWGTDVSVWAYIGSRDFANNSKLKEMSAYYHVTSDFPATYITGGNGDPLTNAQSKPFADKLESLGVNVTRLFYPEDHQPSLPHEYQFNLDNEDGKRALAATVAFLKDKLK